MSISTTNRKNDGYGGAVFGIITLFVLLSGLVFYQFLPVLKFPQNGLVSFMSETHFFILRSQKTLEYLQRSGGDRGAYEKIIDAFARRLDSIGIKYEKISEKELENLSKDDVLIALDSYVIDEKSWDIVEKFLRGGGKLFFNYRFGYFADSGGKKYRSYSLVEELTGLKSLDMGVTKKENGGLFVIPKILSPLMLDTDRAKRSDLIIYDPLPLFDSSGKEYDMMLSDWSITSTPKFHGKRLGLEKAGVAWHGAYGRGEWYYFSFPAYSFLEFRGERLFSSIVGSSLHYLKEPVGTVPYPYMDSDKAIFISEDTEFKYQNMSGYSELAKRYDINTTLFCVAKLAEKYPKLTKKISALPNIEIASHSYSHSRIMGMGEKRVAREIAYSKKVLEEITGKELVGFRPPREEIDELMALWLKKAGYRYTMERTKDYLVPSMEYEGIVTIPRHGTDDYQYFVQTEMSDAEVLEDIEFETEMLSSMNILYTLSVHTHLLSAGSNLSLLERYFSYLKKRPDIVPMKGEELAFRANTLSGIKISTDMTTRNIIVNIENRNDYKVNNFKFRLYWHGMKSVGSLKAEMLKSDAEVIAKNEKERYSDISLKTLSPNSTLSLMLDYEK
jgi:hypothetical protein